MGLTCGSGQTTEAIPVRQGIMPVDGGPFGNVGGEFEHGHGISGGMMVYIYKINQVSTIYSALVNQFM